MPFKDKEKQKKAQHEEYLRHKERYRERTKNKKKKLKEWFQEYKKTLCCSRCSESDPACFHFHHKDPSSKDLEISRLVSIGSSMRRIMAEIAKCEVLCVNCHRLTIVGTKPQCSSPRLRWIRFYKKILTCSRCGFFAGENIQVLDFHHTDPSIKIDTVSNISMRKSYCLQDLIDEVAKCIPLCGNCHAKEHAYNKVA